MRETAHCYNSEGTWVLRLSTGRKGTYKAKVAVVALWTRKINMNNIDVELISSNVIVGTVLIELSAVPSEFHDRYLRRSQKSQRRLKPSKWVVWCAVVLKLRVKICGPVVWSAELRTKSRNCQTFCYRWRWVFPWSWEYKGTERSVQTDVSIRGTSKD